MNDDVKLVYDAMVAKQPRIQRLYAYFDGYEPLRYSTERLEAAFHGLRVNWRQNWSSVVVNVVLERLILRGWDVGGAEELNNVLDGVWESQQVSWDAADVHLSTLVTGDGYIIAWPSESGDVEVYWNDSRNCHVIYDAKSPKRKRLAAKWWDGEDRRRYLNLYYPDRIEHWVSRSTSTSIRSAATFQLEEAEENPYGEIPVFHFRRERRGSQSELDAVIPLHDSANKLVADMMIAGEFAAFRQRVVISDADTTSLKNSPNEIWTLPSGSSVAEFAASELQNYLKAIDQMVSSLAIISRTPAHYFYNQGANISGDALLTMEAPLTAKVERYQERLGVTWKDLGRFILRLRGYDVAMTEIFPVWASAETVQPEAQARVREIGVKTGLPLTTLLRREGWSNEEIQQMWDDAQEQAASQVNYTDLLLEQARREMEHDGVEG